jgi:hypothetical protein
MLMKTPPHYREISGPVRRRPRWGLFLACLPLSGLLLGLFACALIGAGTALFWLATPPESDSIARVRRLQPLPLPTLAPTLTPAPVADPETGEVDPAEQNSLPPTATPSPTSVAPVTPTPDLGNSPALSVAAVTGSSPVPAASPPPTPLPTFTPAPGADAGADATVESAGTPPTVPIPDSWKDYMKRN